MDVVGILLAVVTTVLSVIGGTLSAVNMMRTLRERTNYRKQTKNLFSQVLLYSLASNELLLNLVLTADSPVKTYEIYSLEIEGMQSNLMILSKIDLSRVTITDQKNIHGYMYHYRKYINYVEEYLIRLKKRSDYMKEVIDGEHEFRSIRLNFVNGEESEASKKQAMNDLIHNDYGIDYIIVEEDSEIQQNFVDFLKGWRQFFQEVLESTESTTISQLADIETTYNEYLKANSEIEAEHKER